MTVLRLAAGLAANSLWLAVPPLVAAPSNCAPRASVVEHLAQRFGEARQSIGIASGDRVVEMFASPDTGTWTLTMTLPDGQTCIIGAGQSFERIDEAPLPSGQPT